MSRSNRSLRWIGAVSAVVLVALAVWLYAPWWKPGHGAYGFDPRPLGTLEDIEQLSRRDDVNVLFILIDTLRAHHLGSYGYERDTSPTLNYLAATGIRFHRQLAQSSWTKCSMASLWTGLYPARTGVLRSSHGAPEEATMPAEIFRDAGFRTTGIYRNGWVAPNFGFGQGFEIYYRPTPRRPSGKVRSENPHITLEGSDNDVTDAALEFLRSYGSDRWFLYMHLMDVHQYLYDEESAIFGSGYSDLYDNAIYHEDRLISRFLYQVGQLGLMDRTLVIIAADHGEAFRERGLEGHARHIYRETTEVPLILMLPFRLEPGITVTRNTRNVDLWPTVLDLLGLPPLPDTDGRSLVREILATARGEPLGPAPPGIAHIDRNWARPTLPSQPRVAVLDGDFRFVSDAGSREELFDRSTDAAELNNLLERDGERAERMRAMVEDYLSSKPSPWGVEASNVELDEMDLNQLRALGYAVP